MFNFANNVNISKIQNYFKDNKKGTYLFIFKKDLEEKIKKLIPVKKERQLIFSEILDKEVIIPGFEESYRGGKNFYKFMNIPKTNSKTKYYCGLPHSLIKKIIKEIRRHNYIRDIENLASIIEQKSHLSIEKSEVLAQLLLKEGYLAFEKYYKENVIGVTQKGVSLSLKKIGNPISAEKAELLISTVAKKIVEINNNPKFPYFVSFVGVHGSFCKKEKDFFGDVDFMYRLVPKDFDSTKQQENEREFTDEFGPKSLDWFGLMAFPHTVSLLKGRNKFIDMQPYNEEIFKNTPEPRIIIHNKKLEEDYRECLVKRQEGV